MSDSLAGLNEKLLVCIEVPMKDDTFISVTGCLVGKDLIMTTFEL